MAELLKMRWTAPDYIAALDTLEHAERYIAAQFLDQTLPTAVLGANLATRALLVVARIDLMAEAVSIFDPKARKRA